jgi:hypothetical protein
MTLTSETFISDIILFLRNYLKDNIDDPLNRSSGFVMTAYPKREVNYPLITLKSVNISSKKLGMRSDSSWCSFDVEVRVWSLSNTECDKLTQKVIECLRTAQYASDGTTNFEIFDYKLDSVNNVVEENGDQSLFSKVCKYNYKVVLE